MSRARLIEELKNENLCTYFILPLVKLNKISFTTSVFKESFVDKKGFIAVQVVDPTYLSRRVYHNSNYKGTRQDGEGNIYLIYAIPQEWFKDLELFIEGKYSEMSEAAKEIIKERSGLENRVKKPGKKGVFTDGRLVALDKGTEMKKVWEEVLTYVSPEGSVVIPSYLPEDSELLSIPGDVSFIDIDSLITITEPRD